MLLPRRLFRPPIVHVRTNLSATAGRAFSLARRPNGRESCATPQRHVHTCRRALTTPPRTNASGIPVERYNALADATMATLLERLEQLLDGLDDKDMEVDYHGGVLTLNLGSYGTYVINKQPPNKQIWLSSPISGPKRYDYISATDDWRYSRDGEQMGRLMEHELSGVLGRVVKLNLERVSELG